jgi:hypothetical protein
MLATAKQYRLCAALIECHNLGQGHNRGASIFHAFRQFYPFQTDALHDDLHRLGVDHQHTHVTNDEHPDYGKPIFEFTLVPPLNSEGQTITTVAQLDEQRAAGKTRDDGRYVGYQQRPFA